MCNIISIVMNSSFYCVDCLYFNGI